MDSVVVNRLCVRSAPQVTEESLASMRMVAEFGSSTPRYRLTDRTGTVRSAVEFADRGAVDAFETLYAQANVEYQRQYPGAVHEIVDHWVGKVLPSHTMRLE